jgi:hypothetical protein
MQRGRGAIEADVTGDARGFRQHVEGLGLGNLMDEAPAGQNVEKIGFVGAHAAIATDARLV